MLVRLNNEHPQEKDVQRIVDCLKNNGIIIYPSDTVYSMGCDITKPKAYEKLCRLKNIKPDKANFSFMCSDLSHLSQFTKPISTAVFRLMKKALPGPYTFILEANINVQKQLRQNKKTVGIRVPDSKICHAIIETLGNPIFTTSLHNHDEIMEYYTDPEVIHQQFEDKVDIVVDGGFGNLYASTVIDFTNHEPVVIREGMGSLDILNNHH